MLLTEDRIRELIECPKRIVKPPRRTMQSDGPKLRNEMSLESESGVEVFHVYMRVLQDFRENFSIGLDFVPGKGESHVPLLRYNGPHGGNSAIDPSLPHFVYHIHRASASHPDRNLGGHYGASPTDRYGSYDEALAVFLKDINVIEFSSHFPGLLQLPLSFGDSEVLP